MSWSSCLVGVDDGWLSSRVIPNRSVSPEGVSELDQPLDSLCTPSCARHNRDPEVG